MYNPSQLNRVLVILFYGRSGTLFFQSLLDSHPELLMLPGIHLICYYEFWSDYGHLPYKELVREFVKYYSILFDARNPCEEGEKYHVGKGIGDEFGFTSMGPDRNQSLGINREVFIEKLEKILSNCEKVSRKFFFQAIHVAYHSVLHNDFHIGDKVPIIVYHLHCALKNRVLPFLEDFPDSLFLYVIRSPIQSLGSMIIYHNNNNILTLDKMIWILEDILFGGTPVVELYAERFKSVKLEDLHKFPEDTMRSVSRWLGISWHDNLLKSTFDGIEWWNVRNSPQIKGFSNETISKKHENVFTDFDRMRLEILLRHKYSFWRYSDIASKDYQEMKELLIKPFKMEEFLLPSDMDKRDKVRDFLLKSLDIIYHSERKQEAQLINPGDNLKDGWTVNIRMNNFTKLQMAATKRNSLLINIIMFFWKKFDVQLRIKLKRIIKKYLG